MKEFAYQCQVGEFLHIRSLERSLPMRVYQSMLKIIPLICLHFKYCSRVLHYLQQEDMFYFGCVAACLVVGSSEGSGNFSSPLWTYSFQRSLWFLSVTVVSLIWFCEVSISNMSNQWILKKSTFKNPIKKHKPIKMCHLEIFIFQVFWSVIVLFQIVFWVCAEYRYEKWLLFPPEGLI